MGVLSDRQLKAEGVITPWVENGASPKGAISYGVSSYGYDVRAADHFQVFSSTRGAGGIIDPKDFNPEFLEEVSGRGHCIIPPNAFALAYTLERITVPKSCIAIVLGKSTLARCGLIVNVTPLEPEWQGHVTMELSNTASLPQKVYAEGIAQILFLRSDGFNEAVLDSLRDLLTTVTGDLEPLKKALASAECAISYADKRGRYQGQGAAVTLPCATGGTSPRVGLSPLPVAPDAPSEDSTSSEGISEGIIRSGGKWVNPKRFPG